MQVTDGSNVHGPYSDAAQQHEAGMLGMYLFLGSEIMLFGGLFAVALVLRILHPAEVVEASKKLHVWIGALNTGVLLTSSFVVAVGVQGALYGMRSRTIGCLLAAAVLGVAFLGIKAFEYSLEYADRSLPGFGDPLRFARPVQQLFMDLYVIATGLHAIHVTIGLVLLTTVSLRLSRRSSVLPQRAIIVETAGLYWHLVDAIWIFLYPVLYLAR
jgi:cytochrome c oxidase subunit 3